MTDRDARNFSDLLYSARWLNGFDLTDTVSMNLGVSGLWGLFTQALWGFRLGWVVGLRWEYATADGDTADDPFRDTRKRLGLGIGPVAVICSSAKVCNKQG